MRALFGLVLLLGVGLAGFAVYMVQGYVSDQDAVLARERAKAAEIVPTTKLYAPVRTIAYGEAITEADMMDSAGHCNSCSSLRAGVRNPKVFRGRLFRWFATLCAVSCRYSNLGPKAYTHNIPGKFISYMRCGLPVLASINYGNDLNGIIIDNDVGEISKDNTVESLRQATLTLCDKIEQDSEISTRCEMLGKKLFSPQVAAQQILEA